MQLSVVIPVHNESENIGQLLQEIDDSLNCIGLFEVVVVDDGSTDKTLPLLNELTKKLPNPPIDMPAWLVDTRSS